MLRGILRFAQNDMSGVCIVIDRQLVGAGGGFSSAMAWPLLRSSSKPALRYCSPHRLVIRSASMRSKTVRSSRSLPLSCSSHRDEPGQSCALGPRRTGSGAAQATRDAGCRRLGRRTDRPAGHCRLLNLGWLCRELPACSLPEDPGRGRLPRGCPPLLGALYSRQASAIWPCASIIFALKSPPNCRPDTVSQFKRCLSRLKNSSTQS
jgi:hypothetical protein